MHNGELAKKCQVSLSTRKERLTKLGVMYQWSKYFALGLKNTALWVWLNSRMSD